jgi:hypothetical protein
MHNVVNVDFRFIRRAEKIAADTKPLLERARALWAQEHDEGLPPEGSFELHIVMEGILMQQQRMRKLVHGKLAKERGTCRAEAERFIAEQVRQRGHEPPEPIQFCECRRCREHARARLKRGR